MSRASVMVRVGHDLMWPSGGLGPGIVKKGRHSLTRRTVVQAMFVCRFSCSRARCFTFHVARVLAHRQLAQNAYSNWSVAICFKHLSAPLHARSQCLLQELCIVGVVVWIQSAARCALSVYAVAERPLSPSLRTARTSGN